MEVGGLNRDLEGPREQGGLLRQTGRAFEKGERVSNGVRTASKVTLHPCNSRSGCVHLSVRLSVIFLLKMQEMIFEGIDIKES